MARIPEETIQEVLVRADIGSVVSRYVSLKKAGANMKGLCPFHSEKTPSFNVHPTKGIYKCFGCGAGGNAIGFLMAIEGWNFPEAVRKLAGEVNVVIPEATPEEEEKRKTREKGRDAYFRVMSIAREYFVDQLWNNSKAEGARFYLKERGIDDETAKTFELGYAPDEWDALIAHFQTHRIPPTWLERAGLVSRRTRGDGFFDKFRHRIMFPVVDVWNNTVAFSGRVLRADDNPKYMNSPETTFYTKGDHLYGLHAAKSAVQKSAFTVVVEGNFDVVSLYAAGVQNVVAPLGTAFTKKQARLIKRYCATAVFAFDGDDAGRKATLRCLPSTEANDLEARVIPFDDGDDPDTAIRREGKEAFDVLVEDALPLVEWAFVEHFPRGELGDVNDNVRAIEFAVDLLKEVKNGVVRARHIQDISRRLAIEPRLLSEYIKRPEKSGAAIRESVSTTREISIGKTEKAILAVLLDNPDWFSEFLNEEYDSIMHSRELAQFFHNASDYFAKANTIIGVEMVAHQGIRKTVVDTKGQEMSEWFPEGGAAKFFQACIQSLQREWADRRGAELAEAIERSNSPEDQRTLVRELQEVVRFKHSIGTSK